ncbi:uncharacterized protein LOC141909094 [Tubulanus polymorphus]|uniref:uncharacterized protein LOC141909094 n=1 Tax=Tubulanus polymorphus TaxID=672921 RepID=UPI003DA63978
MGDTKKENPRSGGCFCGAIRYAFYGYPAQVLHCHCKTCRKLSGNAFSTLFAVSNSQIFLRKESMLRKFRCSSDEVRGFCVKCGCCIFIKNSFEYNTMWLFGGTINGSFGIRISGHIFTKEKAAWYEINDGLPQCETDELWIKDPSNPDKNLPNPRDILDTPELISDNSAELTVNTGKSLARQDSGVRRKGDLMRMHNLVKTEDGKIFRSLSSSSEESVDCSDSGPESRRSCETIHEEVPTERTKSVTTDEDDAVWCTPDSRTHSTNTGSGPNATRLDAEVDEYSSLSEDQFDSVAESSENECSPSKQKTFWI